MSIDNATPEEWDRASKAAMTAAKWAETGFSLETLNAHLCRPFGEVALVDRCLAFALWQSGWPVEYFNGDKHGYVVTDTPLWGPQMRYRILPKPEELVLPSIDWSHVNECWKWLAQDEDGGASLFNVRPDRTPREWFCPDSTTADHRSADGFASFKPGRGDWRKLLVQRPEGA